MADTSTPRVTANRSALPTTTEFRSYISSDWAERPDLTPSPRVAAPYAAARRLRISAQYPGKRLIVPAGPARVRSNDTDHPYRAHSAFAYLTGWGSDAVPDSVLVFEPTAEGHDATLYFLAAAGRETTEFYANAAIGEFWTGPRPSLEHVAADLALPTRDLADLETVLDSVDADTLVVRDADAGLTDQIDGRRLLTAVDADSVDDEADITFASDLSELRFVKDDWEQGEMRAAIAATKRGFDEIIKGLPAAISTERGERVVEGTFNRRARIDGNTVGYDTIAASGPHACYLHWTRNDGPVVPGDLLLVDAGVELDSLYTADITRTLPVNGTFSDIQRRVYDAVLEAADAARAIVKPGIRFREVHAEAMRVIAEKTAEWGLLPGTAEESLDTGQWHRRYMIHGTSHHLGLDVHDCAKARRELYLDGVVEPGMVFTIEPGLYFQVDDLTVPEEFRGIGVRIEDNIVVTEDGCELLSGDIPRTADAVEAWMRSLLP
ncbi:aminopeptidase P family protein [Pseudolysinimonas yzui]|uniref:Xaa-Pro aminopeptidase n=1 Tax=Pseudolysinimonas yzui TaxID=2708254 RepID=A0A8J3DVP3_9MICO|nr:aminopeptidase P family protein [Pseudolysinimonas yzui]GHF04812.1 Xaa-Pro aminopeptidase [Pseudolysinimonas yzui]